MKKRLKTLLSVCIIGEGKFQGIEDCASCANKLTDKVFFIDAGSGITPAEQISTADMRKIEVGALPYSLQTEWVLFLRSHERIRGLSQEGLLSQLEGSHEQGYGLHIKDRDVEGLLREQLFVANLGQYDAVGDPVSVDRIEVRLIRREYSVQCFMTLIGEGEVRRFDSAVITDSLSIETICPERKALARTDLPDDLDEHDTAVLKGEIYYGPVPGEMLDELSSFYNGYRILHMGYLEGFMENAKRGLGTDGMYRPMLEYLNKNGWFKESRELFETWMAHRDGDDNRDLDRTGGIIYAYLFMMDEAISFFEKAASDDTVDSSLLLDMGKLYLINGQRENALEVMERSLEERADPQYRHILDGIRSDKWRPLTVTLCMIARDEEATIGKTLESMWHVADEIIVVDTGSLDRTRDIVRDYGGRIIEYIWNDDFSSARNEAIKEAKGDYIFVLDADEYIDVRNQIELAFLKKILPSDCGTAFKIRIAGEEAPSVMSASYQDRLSNQNISECQVRFFPRREGVAFSGEAFETVEPSLIREHIAVTEVENFKITHRKADGEWRRNRKVSAVKNAFSGLKDPSRIVDGGLFFMKMGDLDAAFPWFERSGRTNPGLLARVAMVYTRERHYKQAGRIIEGALNYFPDSVDLALALAEVCFREEDYSKVKEIVEKIDLGSEEILPEFVADAHYRYGIALLEVGDPVQGVNHTAQALEKNPFNVRYQTAGLYALARLDQWDEFLNIADQIIRNEEIAVDFDIGSFLDIGRLLLKLTAHFAELGREDEAGLCQKILKHLIHTRMEDRVDIDTMTQMINSANMNAFV